MKKAEEQKQIELERQQPTDVEPPTLNKCCEDVELTADEHQSRLDELTSVFDQFDVCGTGAIKFEQLLALQTVTKEVSSDHCFSCQELIVDNQELSVNTQELIDNRQTLRVA